MLQLTSTTKQLKINKAHSINFGPHSLFFYKNSKRFLFRAAVRTARKFVPVEETPAFVRNVIYATTAGATGAAANWLLTRPALKNNNNDEFGAVVDSALRHGYTVEFRPPAVRPGESIKLTPPTFTPAKDDAVMPSMMETFSNSSSQFPEHLVALFLCVLGITIFLAHLLKFIKLSSMPIPEKDLEKLKRDALIKDTKEVLTLMIYSFVGSAAICFVVTWNDLLPFWG